METDAFGPVKTGKKRGPPSPTPVEPEIDTVNTFSSLFNKDVFDPTPSEDKKGENEKSRKRKKKSLTKPPKSIPRTVIWSLVVAAPQAPLP